MLVSDADRAALNAAAAILLEVGEDQTGGGWMGSTYKGDDLVDLLHELAARPAQASDREVGPATAAPIDNESTNRPFLAPAADRIGARLAWDPAHDPAFQPDPEADTIDTPRPLDVRPFLALAALMHGAGVLVLALAFLGLVVRAWL